MNKNELRLCDIDVIAELANAHEGDQELAVEMIDAISSHSDAAKIQMFTADDIAVESHNDYGLYQELSLSAEDAATIVDAAHENGIYLFADVLGEEGLERIAETNVDGFKIHSSDLANHSLISKIAELNKPTLISAGGATSVDIQAAIRSFKYVSDAQVGIVYGFQNYPTKLEDAHLNRLQSFVERFGDEYVVGYTSHVDGGSDEAKSLPAWSVAAGAEFVEIHTTINRSVEGIDYYSSLEPDAFEEMASNVALAKTAIGDSSSKMSKSESEYRKGHKKCVVATRDISPGETIGQEDVTLKRTRLNTEAYFNSVNRVIGKMVDHTINTDELIGATDIEYTVASVLACRAESTRLYGKPLQLLGEKPILAHQITQLQKVTGIDDIILAISDTPSKHAFIEFAETHGLSYVVGDETDVLGRIIDAVNAYDIDIVVRSMTENPFIYQESINKQIKSLITNNADLVASRRLPLGSSTEVISTHALKQAHDFGENRHQSELVTSFLTENPHSFDIVGVEPPNVYQRPDIRLTVDKPCDLMLARKIWDFVSENENSYDLRSIIRCYDKNGLDSINSNKPNGEDKEVIKQSWHIYGDPDERLSVENYKNK